MNSKTYSLRTYTHGVLRLLACALVLTSLSVLTAARVVASDETDVRSAVEQAFGQFRAGDYNALYDVLPTASQRRVTRERFTRGLEQTRNFYELERIEIGAVHVAGDLAVVDSVIYGRARAPFEGEGKIILRQYLLREGGRWRVTLGERNAVSPLLAANPTFARRYPATQPRLYVKRDGKWMDIGAMMKGKRPPK
jgi:hypothetical protein